MYIALKNFKEGNKVDGWKHFSMGSKIDFKDAKVVDFHLKSGNICSEADALKNQASGIVAQIALKEAELAALKKQYASMGVSSAPAKKSAKKDDEE